MKQLHRAACFADWCTHYPRDEHMKPDRPGSLFEGPIYVNDLSIFTFVIFVKLIYLIILGLAGLVYFLNDIKKPTATSFPAYGL